jgi:hypothetical protein
VSARKPRVGDIVDYYTAERGECLPPDYCAYKLEGPFPAIVTHTYENTTADDAVDLEVFGSQFRRKVDADYQRFPERVPFDAHEDPPGDTRDFPGGTIRCWRWREDES